MGEEPNRTAPVVCSDFEKNRDDMNSYRRSVIFNYMEANSCIGKREYMSMREASDESKTVSNRIGEQLAAYQCPFCCLFHVGHEKSKKRIETERKMKQYECQKKCK